MAEDEDGIVDAGFVGIVDAGFAKLQGKDFEYYMQTYSIILGRNGKKSVVDVDLVALGGGMNISRQHARIFYDFQRRHFGLNVMGKNGCVVQGVLYLPGNTAVKLHSQDLLQIGDLKFYFLLPMRSIFASASAQGNHPDRTVQPFAVQSGQMRLLGNEDKRGKEEDNWVGGGNYSFDIGLMGKPGSSGLSNSVGKEESSCKLLQAEEKYVISSVATVLSDLYRPGEWIPMAKLHAKLVEKYGSLWHYDRVRKYLTSDDRLHGHAGGRLWHGLLTLLKKYPEHFVITTRSTEKGTTEFVSLVSLFS